ncbi:MAG: ABC transporter substrate-binding protein [Bacilli bacterium]
MKKLLVLFTTISLLFIGCESKKSEVNEKDYSDYKVISLAPSITENIIGLGMEDTLIAVDTYSIFDETKDLTTLDAMTLNTEEILLLQPTHILVADYNYEGDKKSGYSIFEDEGIKVIPISGANSIDDIYLGISEVGKALDNTDASDNLVDELKTKVEDITNKYSNKTIKKVYMEIAPAPNIYTPGKSSFLNEIITLVGGENIFNDVEKDYFSPSAETIIEENPDVIITNVNYIDNPIDEILSRDGFDNISAVKNNTVFKVATDETSRPSCKFIIGMEEIAKAIHNEKQ